MALILLAGAGKTLAHSDEELAKAKEFIAEKLPPEKKTLLEDLAKEAGKTPEEMFLDITKLTGDETLGTGSNRPNIPEDDEDKSP
jgi:hypothetical protein